MKFDQPIILTIVGLTALAAIGAIQPKLTPLPQASSAADEPNAWCVQCKKPCASLVTGHVSGTVCGLKLTHFTCGHGHHWTLAEHEGMAGVPVVRQERPYQMPPLPTFKHGLTNIQTRLPPMPP